MRFVVGVDLSLTATGIGIITKTTDGRLIGSAEEFKTELVKTGAPDAKGKPTECIRDRVVRSREIARTVWRYAFRADLVVMEGLYVGPNAGKILDRAATWMRIADRCITNDVPLAIVQPKALKLPIAGTGTASKTEMISALLRLWPDVELRSDNEVDALAAAHLGAVGLGWDVPTLERHRQVAWTEWPEFVVTGEAA